MKAAKSDVESGRQQRVGKSWSRLPQQANHCLGAARLECDVAADGIDGEEKVGKEEGERDRRQRQKQQQACTVEMSLQPKLE